MFIYKTTNLINGKIYIGQTHRKSKTKYYLGSGKLLEYALKKYGLKNFSREVVEYCKSQDELNEREIYWIKYFNATDRTVGYNILEGGNGGDYGPEWLASISGDNHYLNKMSPEEREAHADKYKRGENYWKNQGLTTKEEVTKYIQENYLGENHPSKRGKSQEEYEAFLDRTKRGSNFWLAKLDENSRNKYIDEHYRGKNNHIFKGKSEVEIEDWMNAHVRGDNHPNAKYIYTVTTNTGQVYETKCLRVFCAKHNFNLYVLRKFIEDSDGRRFDYTPYLKEYIGWKVSKRLNPEKVVDKKK